nr:expressed protein [Hymenolepis microstoma]
MRILLVCGITSSIAPSLCAFSRAILNVLANCSAWTFNCG